MTTSHEDQHDGRHPTFKQYVVVAVILFVVTIVEFLLIWDRIGISDDLGASKIPLLIVMSAFKFAVVIMFYMHLKFEARLFSGLFLAGMGLAVVVGIALLGIFFAFEGDPRPYAQANAIPYVHEEEAHEEGSKDDLAVDSTSVPPTAVPSTVAPDAKDTPTLAPPIGGDSVAGQTVFTNSGCVACHTIEGVPGAVGQIGPELTHVATIAATRKSLSAEAYIRESIENPTEFVVDGFGPLMPTLRGAMTDEDFENLVAFLLSQN